MNLKGIAIALLTAALLYSCATTGKEPPPEKPPPDAQPTEILKPAQPEDTSGLTETHPQETVDTSAAETSTADVEPPVLPDTDPVPEPDLVEAQEEGAISVTKEVFTKTFSDVEALIAELGKIIRAENYDAWVRFLSKDYISTYSAPKMLEDLSKQPLLQKYNIRLRSLKDYFTYVVVQSRTNASLEDLVFLSENRVKAISVIGGQRVILYILEKSNGSWKIGTLQK